MSLSVLTLGSGLIGQQFDYNSSSSCVLLCLSAAAKKSCPRKLPDVCSDWPVRVAVSDICPSQIVLVSGFSHALLEPGQELFLSYPTAWEQVDSRCKESNTVTTSQTQPRSMTNAECTFLLGSRYLVNEP